ncbi:MAG: hypothetical protein ABIA77_01655, partial [Candidatus Omnitrophota bacterium]
MGHVNSRMFIKVTAVIVSGIFLWNQIAWAGDLFGEQTSPAETIPVTMPANQSAITSLIDTKNAIEDGMKYDAVKARPNGWHLNFAPPARSYIRDDIASIPPRPGWCSTSSDGSRYIYDGNGRIVRVERTNGCSEIYLEYYPGKRKKTVECCRPDGRTEYTATYHYDEAWNCTGRTATYPSGKICEQDTQSRDIKVTNVDGSYTVFTRNTDGNVSSGEYFDAEGNILKRWEYDEAGRITVLSDGAYEEKRRYIFSGSDVLYTAALHEGTVKTVRDGYYTGTDLISRTDGMDAFGDISVTYDGDITVSYAGGAVKALSVDGGYVNFYNGNDIVRQNGPAGELYLFEDNFVKQVFTVSGNVYNFGKTIEESGITVSITDAIVDGVRHDLSGDNITAMRGGRGTDGIDIPNIRFIYSPDCRIREILTSEYSRVNFTDGYISGTVSAEGVEAEYEIIREGDEITGLRVLEGGSVRTFDGAGNLVSVGLGSGEGSSEIKFDGGELTEISSAGALLRDITFAPGGAIDSAKLLRTDGSEYFFTGGALSGFTGGNVEYDVDDTGRITQLRRPDAGETFTVSTSLDTGGGPDLTVFTSGSDGTQYRYRGDMLACIAVPSGLRVDYEYDDVGRTREIDISYGGVRSSSYLYEYNGPETVITDELGNRRYYDGGKRIVKLRTAYDETYDYVYDTDAGGNPITVVNYSRKDTDEGGSIQYFEGRIERIDEPDGSWIDNIEFDRYSQELKRFSLHTADGEHRNVIIDGDFIHLELEDSTRLVFYENTLVALAGSQGIAPLYDMEELEGIVYSRDRPDSPEGGSQAVDIDIAASSWRHQTYDDSRAIRFVERDYAGEQWVVHLDMRTGDEHCSRGEMYLDMRYDIPGLAWQAPIDMRGEEISFLFKLDEDFEYDPLFPCNIQVFAKDSNWNTQYGTKVEMEKCSDWIRVSLVPTEGNINFGYTDAGFDPAEIVMIGLSVSEPDGAQEGKDHFGKINIKHDILPDLFANINTETSPLDGLYAGLGIQRDLARLYGEDEEAGVEEYLVSFAGAMADGPADIFQENMLRQVSWHPEETDPGIKGVRSVYRDTGTGELVLDVDLSSGCTSGETEGEIFFDVTRDVPGLGLNGPVNLTARPVRMLIEVPAGLVGSETSPNGARLFVKDADNRVQYGTWVNLKEGGKWYMLELTPTFGDIPMGYTEEGFDPSRIIKIGVNIATQAGSGTDYEGETRLKFLDGPADPSGDAGVINTPLWMDIRNVKEYLVDENGNYARIPSVNYLSEGHYSYVFNRGSGTEPLADFGAAERPDTRWQAQGGGITGVKWESSGNVLTADMSLSPGCASGEILLDLRYSCYVPGKNWQDGASLDMTRQEISFYVRAADGFSSSGGQRFSVEAFAKDAPSWRTEYSDKIYVDPTGAWQKITLTPSPVEFNRGYVDGQFDPQNVIAIGLRFGSLSGTYTYTGPVEIRYEINALDLGVYGQGSAGQMPDGPVWANQRDLARYLKDNAIALYGDYEIMEEINRLIGRIPDDRLPSGLAAMTVYDKDEKVVSVSRPDGTTTYFDNDGRIDYISFSDGSVFIDYSYDDTGGLAGAALLSARENLKSSASNAVLVLEKKSADILLLLAEQKKLLAEDFMEGVNAQREIFARARAQLEGQRYVEIEHNFLLWSWTERVERQGVSGEIEKINIQGSEYNRAVAEELAKLDAEIDVKRQEILAEKQIILDEYSRQENELLLSILREESLPFLHYYYRDILGRDATVEEITAVFSRIDGIDAFGAGALKAELYASDEYLRSKAFKDDVILLVKDSLERYLAGSGEKALILSGLGLGDGEVITVDRVFLDTLYAWLEGQDIHFGRSAFGALWKMIEGAASSEAIPAGEYRELAKEALLMDI